LYIVSAYFCIVAVHISSSFYFLCTDLTVLTADNSL